MKKQISFFCAVVAGVVCLTATTFGQVLKVEPEKPKRGDKLRITYDPSAPGAAFTPEQKLTVGGLKFLWDGWVAPMKRIPLTKMGKVLTCELTVEKDFFGGELIVYNREKRDEKARQHLMIYREDGQPVQDAYLSQASGSNYQEWIDKELALYPKNYNAYQIKWRAAKEVERQNIKSIIETDIQRIKAPVKGQPLAWLEALNLGYLWLGQEEKSRNALQVMVEKYPDAPQTGKALRNYLYESNAQRFTGTGPEAIYQMVLAYMKRNPTFDSTRRLTDPVIKFDLNKATVFAVLEMVLRRWIADEPQTLMPYLRLTQMLSEGERSPKEITLLSDKALELFFRGKAQYNASGAPLLAGISESSLPALYFYNAKASFKLGKYTQAMSAIKAAQLLSKETLPEYLLVEGSIWEKAGMLTKAEQVYLTASQRGSKEAVAALKAIYLQDGGAPDGFENWLSKRSAETSVTTLGTAAKKSFADFSVTSIAGKKYELAALSGKVIVLNFWFISCGPCRAEMPELNKLAKEYENRGVVFLAATFDDSESIKAFQKEKEFNYEIIPDAQGWIDELAVRGYPTHYILNQQGEVELLLIGGSDKNLEQIRNVLARLVAVK